MLDQQTISTTAIDQALAGSSDPNQIAVLSTRLDAVKDQMIDRLRSSRSWR